MWLAPCTLGEQPAAARGGAACSSAGAGHAASTATFHTLTQTLPSTLNPTHSSLPSRLQPTGIGVVTCFARLAGIVAANTLAGLWHVSHAATLGVCSAGCLLAAALVHRGLPRDTVGASLRDAVGEPELFVAQSQSDAPSWLGPPVDGLTSQGAAITQAPALPPALSEQTPNLSNTTQCRHAHGHGRGRSLEVS